MFRYYLCNNASISLQLEQLCTQSLMNTLLGYTSPDRVAKQVGWNEVNVFFAISNNKRTMPSEYLCVFVVFSLPYYFLHSFSAFCLSIAFLTVYFFLLSIFFIFVFELGKTIPIRVSQWTYFHQLVSQFHLFAFRVH